MEPFISKYNWHPSDVCWEGHYYKYSYPRSFEMRPQRGTAVPSTLLVRKEFAPEQVEVPCLVPKTQWITSTGRAHDRKILTRHFQYPLLNQAGGTDRMTRLFPCHDERIKKTLRGNLFDPIPFATSITKTDYVPKRPFHDFDYSAGLMVNVTPPRAIRVPQRGIKPGFLQDEMFSILRKANPYMSTQKIDFCNPTKENKKYISKPCC